MAFVRKSRTDQEIEDILTTQKELFERLKQQGSKGSSSDEPLPKFIKFTGQGAPIQGVVQSVWVGSEYDPENKRAAVDKNGNEIPQITLTIKLTQDYADAKAGDVRRQGFSRDMLRKLSAALEENNLDEVPTGWEIASAWVGMWENPRGGRSAREHAVQLRKP